VLLARGIGEPEANDAVTSQRCAEADEIVVLSASSARRR
jgi:hypothetical protein